MLKLIYKIILINTYLISYILTDYYVNPDGQTCVDAPPNPSSENDCISYNSENEACCFATIELEDKTHENKCIPVQKEALFALNYLTIFTFTDYNDRKYEDVTAKFQCGHEEGLCGMNSPSKIFQCSEHSSTTKSCCYLTTPTYTECILSPDKYDKETEFTLFGSSTVVCFSEKLRINLYKILLYFIFLMIFFI